MARAALCTRWCTRLAARLTWWWRSWACWRTLAPSRATTTRTRPPSTTSRRRRRTASTGYAARLGRGLRLVVDRVVDFDVVLAVVLFWLVLSMLSLLFSLLLLRFLLLLLLFPRLAACCAHVCAGFSDQQLWLLALHAGLRHGLRRPLDRLRGHRQLPEQRAPRRLVSSFSLRSSSFSSSSSSPFASRSLSCAA